MPPDYKSPFQLPSDQTCTDPSTGKEPRCGQARWFMFWRTGSKVAVPNASLTHAQQGNCPVHSRDYRPGPWQKWASKREAYATYQSTGDDAFDRRRRAYLLNRMLEHVTATNPPDNVPTPIRTNSLGLTKHPFRLAPSTIAGAYLSLTLIVVILLTVIYAL